MYEMFYNMQNLFAADFSFEVTPYAALVDRDSLPVVNTLTSVAYENPLSIIRWQYAIFCESIPAITLTGSNRRPLIASNERKAGCRVGHLTLPHPITWHATLNRATGSVNTQLCYAR